MQRLLCKFYSGVDTLNAFSTFHKRNEKYSIKNKQLSNSFILLFINFKLYKPKVWSTFQKPTKLFSFHYLMTFSHVDSESCGFKRNISGKSFS